LCDFTVLKLKVTAMGNGFNITMMQTKLEDATEHITRFAYPSGTVDGLIGNNRWHSIG